MGTTRDRMAEGGAGVKSAEDRSSNGGAGGFEDKEFSPSRGVRLLVTADQVKEREWAGAAVSWVEWRRSGRWRENSESGGELEFEEEVIGKGELEGGCKLGH